MLEPETQKGEEKGNKSGIMDKRREKLVDGRSLLKHERETKGNQGQISQKKEW